MSKDSLYFLYLINIIVGLAVTVSLSLFPIVMRISAWLPYMNRCPWKNLVNNVIAIIFKNYKIS